MTAATEISNAESTTDRLPKPNWDMTPFFSGVGADDYVAFKRDLERKLSELVARAATPDVETLLELETTGSHLSHFATYLGCLASADARDEVVQRENAGVATLYSTQDKALGALKAAFAAMGDDDFEKLVGDPRLSTARHHLSRIRIEAQQRMPAALEALNSDLSVTGLSAWGRLYDQVTGELTLSLEVPGRDARTVPISMVNSLLCDANGEVREAALRGAGKAWKRVSSVTSACLNSIVGTRLTLYERREIDDFLEPALFDASIERSTLDAMLGTVRSRQEVARRYLREKARALGRKSLRFSDLLAPYPKAPERRVSWEEAKELVLDSFRSFYPKLADYAEHAFSARHIDYEAREGKRPGGFCASSKVIGESRIFLTFDGALGDVQTLAHELGHAFHNQVMGDMRPWARDYPMTLAETASTFAEQIVGDALLEKSSEAERAALLDHRLTEAAIFLLNIPMRFDFEYALYQRRRQGELTVSELEGLMLDAQRNNYGDALDPDALDPWFWSSKLHFYLTDISFYNFPYTFGFLFSLGLFARAKKEGPRFLTTYEELLRQTASAPAEKVVKDAIGEDLSKPDFWNQSIDLIEADLRQFQAHPCPSPIP